MDVAGTDHIIAVERSLASKIEDARDALNNKLIEILGTYKQSFPQLAAQAPGGQIAVCDSLKFLPVFILAMLKNVRPLSLFTRVGADT